MKTLLITGANRGIGLALTEHYLVAGWQVLATCRMPKEAQALNALTHRYRSLTLFTLDVTDYQQVTTLAERLAGQPIDILLNNAGAYGPKNTPFGQCDEQAWRNVLEINTIAPLKLAEAFVPHVQSSQTKVIAAISSKVGSHTENTQGGGYIYRSSKAALNSVIKSLHNDLSPYGIKTISLHPGWVKTEMGGPNALIDANESAKGLKAVLDNLTAEQSGGFYNYLGQQLPW